MLGEILDCVDGGLRGGGSFECVLRRGLRRVGLVKGDLMSRGEEVLGFYHSWIFTALAGQWTGRWLGCLNMCVSLCSD